VFFYFKIKNKNKVTIITRIIISILSFLYKRPIPTRYENLLASALDKFASGITYIRNPEVWLSACIWYTPDFIVGHRLVVEVDGGVHNLEYRKTPDRIRQRALENMGYHVYRVRNEEVKSSPKHVAEKIIESYYDIIEKDDNNGNNDNNNITQYKIQKIIKKPNYNPLPEDLEQLPTSMAIMFNSQQQFNNSKENNWTTEYFKESLSQYDQRIVSNKCAMERFMLQLLGLNLCRKEDLNAYNAIIIDFEHFSILFGKVIKIISDILGSQISGNYLKNSFNITAPNFIKNLVFEGGPKINPGIVSIKDSTTLEIYIERFNRNFSKLGIFVAKSDVMIECIKELEKRKKMMMKKTSTNNTDNDNQGDNCKRVIEGYQWLIEWSKSSSSTNQ
jgi:hypothetical protein